VLFGLVKFKDEILSILDLESRIRRFIQGLLKGGNITKSILELYDD